MNFSQAIVKAITESVNVEFSENAIEFVILAPRANVPIAYDFYPGKAIIQIEGGRGREIDFIGLKEIYDDLALFKGDKIMVCRKGEYIPVSFHHMYKYVDEAARIIAFDFNGEKVHVEWTAYCNHL